MRDIYEAGQVGAQGPQAHAHNMTFNQVWNQLKDDINLSALAIELMRLRLQLKEEAIKPEQDIAIATIASAEICAKKGNGPKTFEYLSKAGKWTLDIATKIGLPIAAEAIKKALGL